MLPTEFECRLNGSGVGGGTLVAGQVPPRAIVSFKNISMPAALLLLLPYLSYIYIRRHPLAAGVGSRP
jgi:hypothetical protein